MDGRRAGRQPGRAEGKDVSTSGAAAPAIAGPQMTAQPACPHTCSLTALAAPRGGGGGVSCDLEPRTLRRLHRPEATLGL